MLAGETKAERRDQTAMSSLDQQKKTLNSHEINN
uniref:Uncharacterized protein n=1 Tax=Rhizophora mucronata TaxID=61149 RepID=A0A2P2M1D0_RHIMU